MENLGEKGKIFCEAYGLSEIGNYFDESTRMRNGKNIPFLKEPKSKLTKKLNMNLSNLKHLIKGSRLKLFKRRKERFNTFKDNKILTDWNGLIIALAQAGIILKNENTLRNQFRLLSLLTNIYNN